MTRRTMYSFRDKKHSKGGIFSTVLSLASLLIFLALALISFLMKGEGGVYIGTIGLTAMVVSICGFITGLISFSEEDTLYFFSKLGSVLGGLIMIGWISIILFGV
jgi:hypothetical protein